MGEAHLVLRFLDPGFGRSTLTVGAMGRPGAERFAGDVAEGVIPHHRQEFGLQRVGGVLPPAAHRDEKARARPAVGLMGKLTLFPARLAAPGRPMLLGEQKFQVT